MILCVILLWPSKIKCSLILMQNMFNVGVLRTNWLKNYFFERSRLNPFIFEKLLISYICISFRKHCALRSFSIKMLCFSKICFFQIFDWSNFRSIKIRKLSFIKKASFHVFITFSKAFSNFSSLSLLDWSNLNFFVVFYLNLSRVFVF